MRKMIKKLKGFTLIELLAVIVILAIIALIAVPLILNMIEESRVKSAVISGRNYVKAVDYKIAQDTLNDKITPLGEYVIGENELKVSASNIENITGSYEIGSKGVLTAGLCVNGYSVEYSNGKAYHKKDINYCGEAYVFEEPNGVLLSSICEGESENTIYQDNTEFKLKTVEDLVCFSQLVNGGKNFSGKKVYLLSDLDISNASSYKQSTTTKYGDVNGNSNTEGLLTELTTGAGFKPIGNNSNKFSGTFDGYAFTISNLMINRNTQYLGLFGANAGTIRGLRLKNISITSTYNNSGNEVNVGGLVGYNTNSGVLRSIDVQGAVVTRTDASLYNVGGIAGRNEGTMASLLFKGSVKGYSNVGGLLGWRNSGTISGVVYDTSITSPSGNGKLTGSGSASGYNYNVTRSTTNGNGTQGVTLPRITLEGVDGALDTYIGGDNDSDGYYFDYDSEGNITVFSKERKPIENKLKGEGTAEKPYIIKNDKDWKMASALATQSKYFSVANNIDFTDKKFYPIGTNSNKFNGNINGNMNTISNIDIAGGEEFGLFGYNNGGTIEGLVLDNVTVTSTMKNVGAIAGTNTGLIKGIKLRNVNVTSTGTSDVINTGGLVGYNTNAGTIKSIDFQGTVTTRKDLSLYYIGGLIGTNEGTIASSKFTGSVTGYAYVAGLVGWRNNGTISGVVHDATITGPGGNNILSGSGSATGYNYNVTRATTNGSGTQGVTLPRITLEGVDGALDTYIGGDNDNDGYYFDYDNSGNIVLYSTVVNPMTNTLKGSGTSSDPYKISSYNDWKVASTLGASSKHFSVTADIDFTGKKFYPLGTSSNKFNGNIKGNMKTLSNIDIAGGENIGLFGYNNGGTIEGLVLDNVTVTSTMSTVGGIAGTNTGTIKGIKLRNLNVSTTSTTDSIYTGGLVGHNTNAGTIKEVDVQGTVTTRTNVSVYYIGGIVGGTEGNVTGSVFRGSVTGYGIVGGIVGWRNGGTISGVVYNTSITGPGGNNILTGSGSATGYNYNVTRATTNGSGTQGTTLTSLTLDAVKSVLDTTDSDSDGYYFAMNNSNLELLKSN